MDYGNFNNIFKNISNSLYCPHCGHKFGNGSPTSVNTNQSGYVVSLKCSTCNLNVMINIVTPRNQDEYPIVDHSDPISVDEVIEFYKELASFNGDFQSKFLNR